MSSYGGGRGGYRGSGGGGGRNRNRGGGRDGRGGRGPPRMPKPSLNACTNFMEGNCKYGDKCHNAHVLKRHANIEATTPMPQKDQYNNHHNNHHSNNNHQQMFPVTSLGIWAQQDGSIQIFTGSDDGFWRLWSTNGGQFTKSFEHNMNGMVKTIQVASNYLFCGFEAANTNLPGGSRVGMIHAWNLANTQTPPLEFHMQRLSTYAHASAVTCLKVQGDMILSGDSHGVMRMWKFDQGAFKLLETFHGHAGEITGMELIDNKFLWSSSKDCSIRLWDLKGDCQHVITSAPAPGQQTPGPGHTAGVTGLVSMQLPNNGGTFILSGSLDGTIKAWNGATGECVASEDHGEVHGIVSMALTVPDPSNPQLANPLLLLGCGNGTIMCRNLVQTAKAPAFGLLFIAFGRSGHYRNVNTISAGPQGTFYTGGYDGKLKVWQIMGDLGL